MPGHTRQPRTHRGWNCADQPNHQNSEGVAEGKSDAKGRSVAKRTSRDCRCPKTALPEIKRSQQPRGNDRDRVGHLQGREVHQAETPRSNVRRIEKDQRDRRKKHRKDQQSFHAMAIQASYEANHNQMLLIITKRLTNPHLLRNLPVTGSIQRKLQGTEATILARYFIAGLARRING